MAYWEVTAQSNDIVENGNDTIAVIGDDGYTVTLSGCAIDVGKGLMFGSKTSHWARLSSSDHMNKLIT